MLIYSIELTSLINYGIFVKEIRMVIYGILCLGDREKVGNGRKGDVNGDGNIDAGDKRMIYNHIAGTNLLWQ